MPYRHAHWYLLIVALLAGAAFWPSYLSRFTAASAEFHLHGITAALWLALLMTQSWTIQGGRRELHRAMGVASLALFPLFLAGGAGIFIGMARRLTEGASPFYTLYAARLAWVDIVSVIGFALLFHQGLRHRRQTQLHARYMLATMLFLLPPILGRLAPLLPGLGISGPADFWKLGIGFQLAHSVAAATAFLLAARSGPYRRPWIFAGVGVLLAALMFQTVGGMPEWRSFMLHVATWPVWPLTVAAALGGVAVAASGWIAGSPGIRSAAVA